jgi:hypothetical protein
MLRSKLLFFVDFYGLRTYAYESVVYLMAKVLRIAAPEPNHPVID